MPGSDDSAAVSPGLDLPLAARGGASIFGGLQPSALLTRRSPAFNIHLANVDAGTANTKNVVAYVSKEVCFTITLRGDESGYPLIKFKDGGLLSGKNYSEIFIMIMNSDYFAICKNGNPMAWKYDEEDESSLISNSRISRLEIDLCNRLIKERMHIFLEQEESINLILNKVKLTEFEEYTDDACSDQDGSAGSSPTSFSAAEDGSHSGDNYDWPQPN
jgi:hypothetical protein